MQGKRFIGIAMALPILTALTVTPAEATKKPVASNAVVLSVPKTRGMLQDQQNGVAKIKLVNPRRRSQDCKVSAQWDNQPVSKTKKVTVYKASTFWFTNLKNSGVWTFKADCPSNASATTVDIEPVDGPVVKPRLEHQAWYCDDHGFLSFNIEYSNYLSTGQSSYWILYRGVEQQDFRVKGSMGKWVGIDGVTGKNVVEVAALDENQKEHHWFYDPPHCHDG